MKVIFTCGGTAGHINPAVAVASRIETMFPGSEILFVGAKGKMEMELVPREGYDIKAVEITNISREKSLAGLMHNINTIKNIFASRSEARRIIKEFKPDVVIGTGGYVCYPVINAAHSFGIPTMMHESNATPGLTTKMLAKIVDRVLVGMEGCAEKYPDPKKVTVTGTPVRADFAAYTKAEAKQKLGLKAEDRLVLSVWGSLGAGFMNEIMQSMIPMLDENTGFKFIHVTGARYYKAFMEKLNADCPEYEKKGADVREYLHDMPVVMSAADLVICRAGASTLSELSFMKKPSVLIPSPNVVNNHQEKNARFIEQKGGTKVLLEGEFTPESLLNTIKSIVTDKAVLENMSESVGRLAYEDAAERIAEMAAELVNKNGEGRH